ncbi:alpha/beta hydrolase [Desulfatirhabdium butyrativorans]|uniref:alpha/beta hydrolase n=1 Tax=Desulfatirhabdium butyrativorans TaxID=340467 RepID=UPI00047F545C|nr:alpha/beta fold hydrolase [Desulfatirhabdium butyrativorans]
MKFPALLQVFLRLLQWLPVFGAVRDRYVHAVEEYETDRLGYHIPDESPDASVGRPILLRGWRRAGVLLLHGYMAAPLEMAELARAINHWGHWVYVPRIRGHGTSPEDLAIRTVDDWRASVDAGYDLLQQACRRIALCGFSAGAMLAFDRVIRKPEAMPGALVAISPPFKLVGHGATLVMAIDRWNRIAHRMQLQDAQKQFVENHPDNPHINYHRNPISGVIELEKLVKAVSPHLPQIQLPAWMIQGSHDPLVDESGSRKAFYALGSERKCYTIVPSARHGIVTGPYAELVQAIMLPLIQSALSPVTLSLSKGGIAA